jgi:AraC family transcriptional regulator, dual regulator of chb operon
LKQREMTPNSAIMRDVSTAARLSHATVLPRGKAILLTRATLASRRPAALHAQDFGELLWVQNGLMRLHLQAETADLAEGELAFIRPGDAHALQARADDTMVVSVSIHPDLLADLGRRHTILHDRLFWSAGPAPERRRLDSRALAEVNQAALRLERSIGDSLAAEVFLLPILSRLTEDLLDLPTDAPDWLVQACLAAQDPAVFRDGAAGFARVADRAHPHVSRTVRRLLGVSPTDWINRIRMDHAARKLAGSTDSLAEVAAELGIPNLSHFHKLFRAHHGQTPAAWRRAHQQDVIQPD